MTDKTPGNDWIVTAISVLCIRSVHLVRIIYCEMAWHEGLLPAILSHKRDKTGWRTIKPKNINIWSPLDTGNPQNQNTYKQGNKTENTEIQKIIKTHRVIRVDHWFSLWVIQQPPSLSLFLLLKNIAKKWLSEHLMSTCLRKSTACLSGIWLRDARPFACLNDDKTSLGISKSPILPRTGDNQSLEKRKDKKDSAALYLITVSTYNNHNQTLMLHKTIMWLFFSG